MKAKPGDLTVYRSFALLPNKLCDGTWVWLKPYNVLERRILEGSSSGSPGRGGIKYYNYEASEVLLQTPLEVDPVRLYLEKEAARVSKLNDEGIYTLTQFLYGETKDPIIHDLRK